MTLPLGCFTVPSGWNAPLGAVPISSSNSRLAASSGSSPSVNCPFGSVHAPGSLRAHSGPPGCASSTSRRPPVRRYSRMPAACFAIALVRFREPGRHGGRRVALDARRAGRLVVALGDVADRRLRLRLDVGFALALAAPRRDDESGASFHDLLELRVRVRFRGVLIAELHRAVEQALLDFSEQR